MLVAQAQAAGHMVQGHRARAKAVPDLAQRRQGRAPRLSNLLSLLAYGAARPQIAMKVDGRKLTRASFSRASSIQCARLSGVMGRA